MRNFILRSLVIGIVAAISSEVWAIGVVPSLSTANKWPAQQNWNMPPALPPDNGAKLVISGDRDQVDGQDTMVQLHVTADVFPYLTASLQGQELYWEITKPGLYMRKASTLHVESNARYNLSITGGQSLKNTHGDRLEAMYGLIPGVGGDYLFWNGGSETGCYVDGNRCVLTCYYDEYSGQYEYEYYYEYSPAEFKYKYDTYNSGFSLPVCCPLSVVTDYQLMAVIRVDENDTATEACDSYSNGTNDNEDVYKAIGDVPVVTIAAYLPD